MLGTSYLVYYTCYTFCMPYASSGLSKLHKKSWLKDFNCEDNASKCTCVCASTPLYKDWIYRFTKTCAIFALLTYKLMLTHSVIVHQLLTTTWHTPDGLLWYGLQFFHQGIDTVVYILWIMRPLANTSGKNVPGMF